MTAEAADTADLDIHASGAYENGPCIWSRLREQEGLAWSPRYGGFYVAARYEDALQVLTKPGVFGSGKGITLPPPDGIRSFHIPAEIDPPLHGEYRALMQPQLDADRARSMEPAIREIVDVLVERLPLDTPFDFVRAFARPLPIMVALDIMRLDRGHAAELEDMVEDLHREVATGMPTGAAERLKRFAEHVLAQRRRTLRDEDDDVVASILRGSVEGRALGAEEQMSMLRQILVGGFDTTAIALATMMKWLAENPQEVARLRANPGLIDSASEEIVRFASPSTYLRREVMEPVELAGTKLERGDSVLVAFAAANRDPAKFACPEEIDAQRRPNMHLGFGAGRHRCVGSFVAKAQMRIAFAQLLERFEAFELDAAEPIAYSTGLGQGIVSMTMRLRAR
ncbi:cytochrome P450 [Novosphingobium sp. BL-52-GroH]|uniref:cytochrome P450 n=1 Tax=Novosphingobium sp. BL-52-GroH TaxID=3349877 RepID=UPI00384EE3BC